MARILFAIVPERGHVYPYLGTARLLAREGHQVGFFAAHDLGPLLRELGFDQVFSAGPTPPPDTNRGALFATRVRDRAWLRQWIAALLIDAVSSQVEPLERAVDAFAPDVIALDPMVYAAVIVALRREIPWVGISSSLNPVVPPHFESELIETVRALGPQRDALFTDRGLAPPRFSVCDALSPHEGCNLVYATEALVGPPPPNVTLVGAPTPHGDRARDESLAEIPLAWERFEGPHVYMSLGSQLFHQPAMFRLAIDACARLGASLLCAAGDLADDPLFSRPNVYALRFAPQLRALAFAHGAITHGGANSVAECCSVGVPMLVSAVCNDQPHNARFVEASGNGLALDLTRASVDELTEALARVLDPAGPIAARASAVARAYRRDGSRAAADAIARHATR